MGWIQVAVFLAVLVLVVKPLGLFMAKVFDGERTFLSPVLGPLERLIYKLIGVRPDVQQTWKTYAVSVVVFNALGGLMIYAVQRLQGILPLNPQKFGPVSPDSSFNTAISFITNTNWQGYGGESTMGYLMQMMILAVHNFLSAATGIAVLLALTRGIRNRENSQLGSFWVDITRSTVYVLLPLSLVFSLFLVSRGVVQTLSPSVTAQLMQPVKDQKGNLVTTQTIAVGPVASQEAIKELGTNGGGFFNANSAHPFENPTPLTNFIEELAMMVIPAALCITFGQMVRDRRQGWALFSAMFLLFVAFLMPCVQAERSGNPAFQKMGMTTNKNWEGKETRFGVSGSALFATSTTATACGAVNAMHDSFTPIGGMVPMVLIQLGEVVFGGVGAGLYGMLIFAIIGVFIAGLMVGRTPEYIGKKIESYEMKMASLVVLIPCCLALFGTAVAIMTGFGQSSMNNTGPHGFSELLYAYSSMSNNNGSAFAGFNANVPFHNWLGGAVMWFARFWFIVPVLAIAGSLSKKKIVPEGAGTLPTHTPLFIGFLCVVVLVVGALTFIPALALGPVIEHLQMIGVTK